jgi:3-methyl-2-oxobutanoate hydroxymethyltransferase
MPVTGNSIWRHPLIMKKKARDFALRKRDSAVCIAMLTAYDFPAAQILDECGVDILLVGDSLGTTVLGYDDISLVTMDDMLHHLKAVVRGAPRTFILADMPFGSITSPEQACRNASLFIRAGADGVKMEGGSEIVPQVHAAVKKGFSVCAHIGFMPQSGGKPGIVGKTIPEAQRLIDSALALEKAGAFMIVLELIPEKLAAEITRLLGIPTIGIGAGRYCDGQVLVFHDMLGLSPRIFRHVKDYAGGRHVFAKAVSQYIGDVRSGAFPAESNASSMPPDVLAQVREWMKERLKAEG